MTDDEIDKACTFVLKRLQSYRDIADALTKALRGPQYRRLSHAQKKVEKVRLLCKNYKGVISEIFAEENAAWARELKSDISSFYYKLERRANSLNAYGELTGGNFTTKA